MSAWSLGGNLRCTHALEATSESLLLLAAIAVGACWRYDRIAVCTAISAIRSLLIIVSIFAVELRAKQCWKIFECYFAFSGGGLTKPRNCLLVVALKRSSLRRTQRCNQKSSVTIQSCSWVNMRESNWQRSLSRLRVEKAEQACRGHARQLKLPNYVAVSQKSSSLPQCFFYIPNASLSCAQP